jgi:exosortase K
MSRKVVWSAQLLLIVLCALGLKLHYSTATPDQLRWVLTPTTVLVEFLSGRSFQFESYTGYMSSDHTFVIAAPCAGVNFLITAFLMLGLRRLWRDRFQVVNWRFIPLAAAGAYVTTLVANAIRICIALEMQRQELSWLSANQLHRLEGIVVYFGFLLLLFVISERLEAATTSRWPLVFPLLVYYATTLGIPLANGSYRQGSAFWEHAVFVLILPVLVVMPLALFHRYRSSVLVK